MGARRRGVDQTAGPVLAVAQQPAHPAARLLCTVLRNSSPSTFPIPFSPAEVARRPAPLNGPRQHGG